MKMILSGLLGLSVLAGIGAASAYATIDAKDFYDQQERQSY